MKATGIVRRIDDLGRIVIPKEIRRTMRIAEGTPLEIFTDIDNTITLKKYSPVKELESIAQEYAEALSETLNCTVCICDNDTIVAVHHGSKKEYKDAGITQNVAKIIWDKKNKLINRSSSPNGIVVISEKESNPDEYCAQCFAPILPEGDAIGCVIAFTKTPGRDFDDTTLCAVRVTAALLARQMTV